MSIFNIFKKKRMNENQFRCKKTLDKKCLHTNAKNINYKNTEDYLAKEIYYTTGIRHNKILEDSDAEFELVELWDGTATECHVFLYRKKDKYYICQTVYFVNSGQTTICDHPIQRFHNIDEVLTVIEIFCKMNYGEISGLYEKLKSDKNFNDFLKCG